MIEEIYNKMKKEELYDFIKKQKTAFLSSVDESGFPLTRAMLMPRRIEGNTFYFSTNTSSKKVKQFLANPKACIYFYKKKRFKYQGLAIQGTVEVCIDQETKDSIWSIGDRLFYKEGRTDPDYCVLKFTSGTVAYYYCDLKTEIINLD